MFPEANRREKHLLGGLGIQVLVVGLLVFVYTQAARQVNYRRGQFLRFQEQLSAAKAQAEKVGQPDLEKLRAKVTELESRFVSSQAVSELAKTIESAAREKFGFREVTVAVGTTEKTVRSDLPGRPDVEANLVGLELSGSAATRNIAAFLADLTSSPQKFIFSLQSLRIEARASDQPAPVAVHLKWLVAVSPSPAAPSDH